MAIGRISGPMLVSNLERQGVDLSFETDLLYLDVANDRIGVRKTNPASALDVDGEVRSTSSVSGNLSLSSNTISSTNTNGNIVLDPAGSGYVVFSDTNGVILPVGGTVERPGSPIEGTFRYNTDLGFPEFYDGESWVIAGPQSNTIDFQTFQGDGSTTDFTLTRETTVDSVFVSINGTLQDPSLTYSITGDQLEFNEAPASGDRIDVRIFGILDIGAIVVAEVDGGTY